MRVPQAKDTKAQEAAFEKCATLGVKGKKKPVVVRSCPPLSTNSVYT